MKAKAFLKPGDFVVLGVLICLCLLLFLLPLLRQNSRLSAVITVNGETVETISLETLQTPETVSVAGCEIELTSEGARFVSADCPDRLCVKTGLLTHAGTAAACVPNRVVLTLKSEKGRQIDEVAY